MGYAGMLCDRKRLWRILLAVVIIFILSFWFNLVYHSISTDLIEIRHHNIADYQIPSYLLSKEEYIQQSELFTGSNTPASSSDEYPKLFRLQTLLTTWPSVDVSPQAWMKSPAHPSRGSSQSLYRFNFQNSTERALALFYRDREVPFIVYNVPELDDAAKYEFTLTNMNAQLGKMPRLVEHSASQNFMYYTLKNPLLTARRFPEWKAPQTDVLMTFARFLEAVEMADAQKKTQVGGVPLYYLTISANEGGKTEWIRHGLPFFDPAIASELIKRNDSSSLQSAPALFLPQPDMSRGINCRFGMKGVTAAAHYDSRRNFIAMIRGRKRYVLLPPDECEKLSLYPKGHPSARHSSVDWANITQVTAHETLGNALATEVMLSMGELLYVPSYWFHYIVSQDASVQCNARSGESPRGEDALRRCGFARRSESNTAVDQAEGEDSEGEDPSRLSGIQEGKNFQGRLRDRKGRLRGQNHKRQRRSRRDFEWSTTV